MLVLPDPLEATASQAFESWQASGVVLVAPPLFQAEVTSVLRENVFHSRLLSSEGDRAFQEFLTWPIVILSPPDLQVAAWALAKALNRRRTYDMQYLALASLLDCELWTGDQRLWNSARRVYAKVRWIGELLAPLP